MSTSTSNEERAENHDDYLHAILGTTNTSREYTPPLSNTTNAMTIDGIELSNNNDTNNSNNKLSKPLIKSGIPGASFNLINSIVGAGIIGIPYALQQSGLLVGILLLLLVSYLTDKSLRIIINLASFHPKLKLYDVRTFEDLASFPFGNIGEKFVLVNMFVMVR